MGCATGSYLYFGNTQTFIDLGGAVGYYIREWTPAGLGPF